MTFHADSFFTIGGAHLSTGSPCQDYAATHQTDSKAEIVVCDGCSTGGRTDVGARLLAHATLASLGIGAWGDAVSLTSRLLGLHRNDLLATRLCASADPFNGVWLRLHGDGVVAIRRKSGFTWMGRYEWDDNTPFYPMYDMADRSNFITRHGGDEEAIRFRATQYSRWDGVGDTAMDDLLFTVREGMEGVTWRKAVEELEDIDCIALFSDGVTQIDGVEWQDAVMEFLAFKSTAGAFVKRRAMAALRRMREVGRGPVDDFSMAVIRVEHE